MTRHIKRYLKGSLRKSRFQLGFEEEILRFKMIPYLWKLIKYCGRFCTKINFFCYYFYCNLSSYFTYISLRALSTLRFYLLIWWVTYVYHVNVRTPLPDPNSVEVGCSFAYLVNHWHLWKIWFDFQNRYGALARDDIEDWMDVIQSHILKKGREIKQADFSKIQLSLPSISM